MLLHFHFTVVATQPSIATLHNYTGSPLRRGPSVPHWVISHLVMAQGTVLAWGLQCWRLNWLSSTCSGGSHSYRHRTQRWVVVEHMSMLGYRILLQVPLETSFGITVTPKHGVLLKIASRNWPAMNYIKWTFLSKSLWVMWRVSTNVYIIHCLLIIMIKLIIVIVECIVILAIYWETGL